MCCGRVCTLASPVTPRHDHTPASNPEPGRDILGIGAFLATSWTWCIGMFLPVILLRDFGGWSFLVFAIPNCVGAALMGWMMRAPGASHEMVNAHRAACLWFSRVTVGFHAFFLMWIVQLESLGAAVVVGLLVNVAVNLIASRGSWPGWSPAALTFVASVACASVMAWNGALGASASEATALPLIDLAWLAPVCFFGFLLCPYLDLSFHAARRTLPGEAGTRAFVAGFGGLFLVMIVLTLAYAGMFLRADHSLGLGGPTTGGAMTQAFGLAAAAALMIHLASQSAFTMHLHLGMIAQTGHGQRWKLDLPSALVILAAMAAGIASPWLPSFGGHWNSIGAISGGEAVYRFFMAFYGLVFPAYVWICVLPDWNARPGRARILSFAAVVGLALPMFHMGFIERWTFWLVPGLCVVLAGRWLAEWWSRPRPTGRGYA